MRTVLFLALLLLPLPAVAADRTVDELVVDLVKPPRQALAYGQLVRRKDPRAIPMLAKSLPFADVLGQHYGCLVLGVYRTPAAEKALRSLMDKRDPHLRVCAGAALYRLGVKSEVIATAEALLAPGIDPLVRYQMITRIWRVSEPPVRSAVAKLLVAGEDERVLVYGLYGLHVLAARKEAVAAKRLLEDERLAVRALAAALLFRFGRERHAALVAEGIRAPFDAREWSHVASYLTAAGRCAPVILDAIVERLGKEKNLTVVGQMLALLARYPHLPAAETLRGLLENKSDRIAAAAYAALEATPGALPTKQLYTFLAAKSPRLRLRAAETLRRSDDEAGFATVVEQLSAETPTVRAEAARVLGGFVKSESVEPLVSTLLDADPNVRAAALASLNLVLTRLFPYRRFQPGRAGYDSTAAPEANREAVETIRTWWKASRTKDW